MGIIYINVKKTEIKRIWSLKVPDRVTVLACEEGRRSIFSVGGVKMKVCGLEQFDPCNDRGLWYGSTCQRCASTDPCCSPLQSMWAWWSARCHTHTQSMEKCSWACPSVHEGSFIYWSWRFGLIEIWGERQTHFIDTQHCSNVLLWMGPLAHCGSWKNMCDAWFSQNSVGSKNRCGSTLQWIITQTSSCCCATHKLLYALWGWSTGQIRYHSLVDYSDTWVITDASFILETQLLVLYQLNKQTSSQCISIPCVYRWTCIHTDCRAFTGGGRRPRMEGFIL